MKSKSLLFALIFITLSVTSQVVPNIDWVKYFSERSQISNVPSAIDANSNVYITGYTYPTSANSDITTVKYDALGNVVWVKHYDNGGNDDANAISIDASGNIYVVGVSDGTATTGKDLVVIKYDVNGNQLWVARYNGAGNGTDIANAIAFDGTTGVFVTGKTTVTGGTTNYVTLKFNANTGAQQWVNFYNAAGNNNDESIAIDFSSTGRLFITGTYSNSSGNDDITNIRMNPNNGNQMWVKTINGSANGNDRAYSLLSDGNDVVMIGSQKNTITNDDYVTLKYNGNNGNTLWQKNYDSGNGVNAATSIVMDVTNNFAVTGISLNGSIYEYHTVMYNNSGSQQWVNVVSTGLSYLSANPQIAVDPIANHFYVCGQKNTNVSDILVYQITPTGNKSWEQTFNGAMNNQDAAVDLVVNSAGIVYVAGASLNSNAKFDYTTIRISQTPVYPLINNDPDESFDTKYQFYKNQGQILTTNEKPTVSDIIYYTENCAPDLFIKDNSFSFVTAKIDAIKSVPDTFQRIDVSFVGVNPYAKTFQEEIGLTSLNYFLPHCGVNGITNVQGYNRLFTPNIYPNVDLHYYSNTFGLKLYFVVKPTASSNNIILNISGATNATITPGGNLKISTFKGDVIFNLTAYQVGITGTPIALTGTPQIQNMGGNNFKLIAPTYNSALPLILMLNQGVPAKVQHAVGLSEWSTPFGGSGYDEIMDIKTDNSGNSYWAGLTNSLLNFPNSTVGFSFPFVGGFDAFIAVIGSAIDLVTYPPQSLMPKGDALVSKTFYGGSGDDKAMGIAVTGNTANSEIFVTGFTNSNDFNVSTLTGAYNQSYSGGNDAFLLHLKYNGLTLPTTPYKYATYIGGTGDDQANDIKISNGNLVIGGKTSSPACANACSVPTDGGFPVCSPSFHSANSGLFDGFITTISLTSSLVNSTFIGGSQDDEIKELAISSTNDIVFVGSSASDDATLNTIALTGTNVYNQNFNGGLVDAIFGRFNLTSSTNNWLSFFGGTQDDYGKSIAIKQNNDFYLSGYTKSYAPDCSTSCYCKVPSGGQFPLCPKAGATTALTMNNTSFCNDQLDGFIALFKEAGNFDWGTYKGGDCSQGTETINSITYGGIANTGTSSFKNLTDGLFFGGATNSDESSINVSPTPYGSLPSNMWYNVPSPSIMSTHGYFGYYDSNLDFLHSAYFLNDIESNQIPLDVSTNINKVHVFQNQLFFAGKTTSTQFARKSSYTTAGNGPSGNLHQSPYINSMTWAHNGPAFTTAGTYVNYEPDAFMVRTSIDGMLMYPVVGIKENTKDISSALKLYPNPTTGELIIEISDYNHKNALITITNLLGQSVYSEKLNTVSGALLKHEFNLSYLNSGMYCISISNDNALLTKTFIKQ